MPAVVYGLHVHLQASAQDQSSKCGVHFCSTPWHHADKRQPVVGYWTPPLIRLEVFSSRIASAINGLVHLLFLKLCELTLFVKLVNGFSLTLILPGKLPRISVATVFARDNVVIQALTTDESSRDDGNSNNS